MHILTTREQEIFEYLIQYYTTKQISEQLNVSEKTIRNHISNVIMKLGVNDRTQAVLELIRLEQLHF